MSEGGLVMQIERQAAVIESLRAELEDELAAEHLKRDSEIRHYDAKWKEFNVQLGVEKARAEEAEARIAELEKDRDDWKLRACFMMVEGVPESISSNWFDADLDAGQALDVEMIKTDSHWGESLSEHAALAAMKVGK